MASSLITYPYSTYLSMLAHRRPWVVPTSLHSRILFADSSHIRSPALRNSNFQRNSASLFKFARPNFDTKNWTVHKSARRTLVTTRTMANSASIENNQVLDSKSEEPPLFDGTTRLYYSSRCPYAQRVWMAVKYKGLNEIECVELSLSDKPAWYKEKVYPVGKVPALEHNGKVTGESMDLLEYLDQQFGGPKLAPTDEAKKGAAAELLKYSDTFNKIGYTGLSMKNATPAAIEEVVGPALDKVETALGKFASEGPFFLGTFGLVDVAYAPFIERFEIAFSGIKNLNVTAGRPNLAKWIEAMDKVEAYASTKVERSKLLEISKRMLESDYFVKVGVVPDQNKAGAKPVAAN